MNIFTIGAVALAIAGGILIVRKRRLSDSLAEMPISSEPEVDGASSLSSSAKSTVAPTTTRSKPGESSEAPEATTEAATEPDGKSD